ncbi:unnamed protein product [Arabidopsis thaliana]|uniref:Uncharacterized protein n=1 Tax=Arabidopsis thaliana TaxID=3702 RepID=A0A5S9XFQ3_ARATH|nr:unnamed protein product [Arabidopsis thaliana]
MASLSTAAFLRNNALNAGATPRVLLPVTTKHIHLAKKADEGAKTIFDATGNLKDKTRMQQKKRWIK